MSLKLENITHRYSGGPFVLDRINFEVNDGETVAIVGPSGSGKTTLLAVIGLLITPTSGSVIIDGTQAPRRPGHRHEVRTRKFAWVFQSMNVLGHRTALDNVAVSMLARGYTRDVAERQGLSALRLVGLDHKAHATSESLSGGELQRTCIARALTSKPPILLADEPTGQLDQRTSQTVLDAMWALLSDVGAAMVVVTHDESVARRCERVLSLQDGRLKDSPQ